MKYNIFSEFPINCCQLLSILWEREISILNIKYWYLLWIVKELNGVFFPIMFFDFSKCATCTTLKIQIYKC